MEYVSASWRRTVMGVAIACFLTCVVGMSVFSFPQTTYAATLSISEIEKQSTSLYESLSLQKRSQAEIDTALQRQFGMQRVDRHRTAFPLSSTNSAITLSSTTIYRSRGTVFLYSDFTWNCITGASCYNDPPDYNDVFGVWFSQNVPVHSTYLSVSDVTGTSTLYQNPHDFSQAGADYTEPANYWVSGVLEISLAGDFPPGCTEVFTKYTHGWTSNEPTSVTLSAGLPPSFGVSVTYSQVEHSWQATGSSPTFVPGPGILSTC